MLPKTLSILEGFGRRRFIGEDFVKLCAENGVTVKLTAKCDRGFYYCTRGKHNIALSTALTHRERAAVGWHEFAHFLQNYHERKTIAAFSNVQPDKESEKLADVFAMIAMHPDRVRITGPMDFIKMIMRTKL
jgi:Zn-dependent peptidase ImmA (M78 family)